MNNWLDKAIEFTREDMRNQYLDINAKQNSLYSFTILSELQIIENKLEIIEKKLDNLVGENNDT